MAKQATGEISLSVSALEDLAKEIKELDTKIASATGSPAQLKKAKIEQITVENADQVNNTLGKIVTSLEKLDTNVLIGLTTRLEEVLKTQFQPKIDSYVEESIKDTVQASSDEVDQFKTSRKALVERDKAIRTILISFGLKEQVDAVPEPSKGGGRPAGSKTGSGAKTGKNKEMYQFTMDGKDRPPSQNTFSSLAYYSTTGVPKALGKTEKADERWGSKDLKEFIASKGVKFGEDDTWEVELPNGKKIGARRMPKETPAETTTETTEGEATQAA